MSIQAENLTKQYTVGKGRTRKQVLAVNDLCFSIAKGERVGFIGPNGAGKSTTIKMLSGILLPTRGTLSVLGMTPFADRKKLSYHIGTIFGQKSQLSYHLPAYDSFQLLASIFDMEKKSFARRLEELAHDFDIEPFLHTPVRQLSLGQRIRCEIVASVLHAPQVLFFDEPTIGLDTIARQRLRDVVLRSNEMHGTTLMVTSHDLTDIEKLCDRIILIMNGSIVCDANINELKKLPQYSTKIMKVQFSGSLPDAGLPFPGIRKQEAYGIEIDLPNVRDVSAVIHELQRYVEILDIELAALPLETIIAEIYAQKAAGTE